MTADVTEQRKGAVVAAAKALREDRLGGGIAMLVAAGYGLMVSKASLVADGEIEVIVADLVGEQQQVGCGAGRHVAGALLKALGPLLEKAGQRPRKLRGITGGRAIDKHRTPPAVLAAHQEMAASLPKGIAPDAEVLVDGVPLEECSDEVLDQFLPENAGQPEAPDVDHPDTGLTAADINAALKRAHKAAGSPDLLGGPLSIDSISNPAKYEAWKADQQKGVDAMDAAVREEGRKLFGGGS